MTKQWFDVDKAGLAQVLERRGKSFILGELLQNAWDEDVTQVSVSLTRHTGGHVTIVVEDDAPEGFTNLADAYTLFAPSKKKGDAEKRGRFNVGEKFVLALAHEAWITTTKGTVHFGKDGRTRRATRRPRGSTVCAVFKGWTKEDVIECRQYLQTLIAPVSTLVHIEGPEALATDFEIPPDWTGREVAQFVETLPTELSDEQGNIRKSARQTTVRIYTPQTLNQNRGWIYEMGIPVVETDDTYIVDIRQKVPLNIDRDNVTPSFLRKVRVAVLNHTADLLDAESTTDTWVRDALASPDATSETVKSIVETRFGKKAVAYDPSDPEANKIAASKGYTIIPARAFSKEEWVNVRNAEIVKPAGQVTPSAKVLASPDGQPPIPTSEWTDDMSTVCRYAQNFARLTIGRKIAVRYTNLSQVSHVAWYGSGELTFNLGRLGKKWPTNVKQVELDELLIHELGHEYSSDHLSHEYYDALCRIGAQARAHAAGIGGF